MVMGTRVKLLMPKKISSHPSRGGGIELIAPRLVVGDKSFKVVRTGYEYQGAIEVTIMVYADDLEIIGEEDENKRTD
jgi:hypothetical protein